MSTLRALRTLEKRIERSARDGAVTRTEKRAIDAQLDRVEQRAEGLVAHTGAPVLAAVDDVRRMDRRALARRADDALDKIADGKHRLWREAKHDARTNPFRHLNDTRSPFAGVRTKDFNWNGKRIHLVAVDLAHPDIRLATTRPGERGRELDSMARSHHAEIAINGDFFSPGHNYAPSGAALVDGNRWGPSDAWEPALVWKGKHAQLKGYNTPLPDWAKNAVSARPTVLRDGDVVDSYPEPDKARASRRTGVGVSKSGRVLYLVAGENLTAKQLGQVLKSVGADDGLAMDAGGSAQMWQKGRGYVQRSSDAGGERRIANAILINSRG